ncbi:lyase family protein [Chloroflexota bacterium]
MAEPYIRADELANEITRPEILQNQPYYRGKGTRFTEDCAGWVMLAKPGIPETWINTMPDVHRLDKAQLIMLIEENIIPREGGLQCLRALKDTEKEGEESIKKTRVEAGAGIFSGENYLVQKLGEEVGGLIHLGRSTGDETTGTLRMAIRREILAVLEKAIDYRETLVRVAEEHIETPFPTYTGFQAAQITSLAHYLLDFVYKASHACKKLRDDYGEVNRSPMGAAIGTGSDFPLNRERVAELLGFDSVITNTHEAISTEDKTFMIEVFGTLTLLMAPVEKLAAYMFFFHSTEFGFVLAADRFCETSSIMPHKRNPFLMYNVASMVHSVYSAFFEDILEETALIAWPRGASIKRAFTNAKDALDCGRLNIGTMKINKKKINENLMTNWCCATDLAGALVREAKLSWRTAYLIVAIIIRRAEDNDIPSRDLNNQMIEEASMQHLGRKIRLSEETIKSVLNPMERIKARTLTGGPAPENVRKMISEIKQGVVVDKEFIKVARAKLQEADVKLDSAMNKLLGDTV